MNSQKIPQQLTLTITRFHLVNKMLNKKTKYAILLAVALTYLAVTVFIGDSVLKAMNQEVLASRQLSDVYKAEEWGNWLSAQYALLGGLSVPPLLFVMIAMFIEGIKQQ
jgi:hypothetical protein